MDKNLMIKKAFCISLGILLLTVSSYSAAKDSTQVNFPTVNINGMVVLKTGRTGNNFYANSELTPPQYSTINTGLSPTASCPPGTSKQMQVSLVTSGGFMSNFTFTGIFLVCNLLSDNNIQCLDARARGNGNNVTTAIAVNWIIFCQ